MLSMLMINISLKTKKIEIYIIFEINHSSLRMIHDSHKKELDIGNIGLNIRKYLHEMNRIYSKFVFKQLVSLKTENKGGIHQYATK
jgi:hypothetical protein